MQHIGVDVIGLGNRRNGGARLMASVDDLRLELRAVSSTLSSGLGVNNGFTSHSVHDLHRGHYRGLLDPAQDDFTGRILCICTAIARFDYAYTQSLHRLAV